MTNKFEFIVPHGRTTAGEAQKFTLSPDPLRPVETDDPTVAELAYMAGYGPQRPRPHRPPLRLRHPVRHRPRGHRRHPRRLGCSMRRPLQDALADAIERIALEDPGLFNAVHVRAIGVPLVQDGALNLRLAAVDLAAALAREVEANKQGRGRVTSTRLDMRLKENRRAVR